MIKKHWIALFFLFLLLPYLILTIFVETKSEKNPPKEEEQKTFGFTVTLYRSEQNRFDELPLRDYLWGALAGEMPASYPKEALKAQVVACYSYLLHRQKTVAEHPAQNFGHDGDICDNPAHCKAYLPPEEAAARYGEDWYETSAPILSQAVDEVFGQALLYDQQPVNAVFHAMSGGYTENAADVWGAEVPYLQSVDSEWDKKAKDFSSTAKFSLDEMREILGQQDCSLGAVTLTEGGSVATQVIGGKSYTGRELRNLFSLRSTRFTLNIEEDTAVFSVSGYGHQVGLSQHGASILAEEGYQYQEILFYYYTGTTLQKDYYPSF